ncbi:MAG TPA: M81 family metallopeptidase [Thermomicrobiales bacterium]|nr:M81 family metallopeptidase [Thermomicrobiales bacterium]
MSEHKTYRVGIGGIAIESSTFSPLLSTTENFWILRGDEIAASYPYFENGTFEGRDDVEWLGTLKARSLPGGAVERASYDAMKGELIERLKAAMPLDGFFFDIHGAMSVVGMDDAEGDLVTTIREVVGPECIISAGMDLHGNVTEVLVGAVDIFTAYREAPHIDAMETKARAVRNLLKLLDSGTRPYRAWVRIPVALPGERTSTFWEPGKTVYGKLTESDVVDGVLDASLWVGYVWADQPRSSATTVVTGTDPQAIAAEAKKIATRYWDARRDFDFGVPTGDADWTIDQALSLNQKSVIISDSGDNPTAGGAGDIPLMVERLLARPELASGERAAIVAAVANRDAVATAKAAGEGAEVTVTIGGINDPLNGVPSTITGTVYSIYENDPVGGDIAVIKSGGVHVIVPERRKPYHHMREFENLRLNVKDHDITVVKIGYLEPELKDAASAAFLALTPGAVNQDIPNVPFERLQRPIYPLDPDMEMPELEPRIFSPIG